MSARPRGGDRSADGARDDRRDLWQTTVPLASRRQLARTLLVTPEVPIQSPEFIDFARAELARGAPPRLMSACDDLARGQESPVALWIRGLPIDPDLPATPGDGHPRKQTRVSEAVLLGIASRFGDPIAYRDEKDGALVQDVFPIRDERATTSNASSEISLDLHTEIAFIRGESPWRVFETSPDFLLLLCLRPPVNDDALTRVVAARALLSKMPIELHRILESPRFRLRAPYSFTRGGDRTRPWSDPVPLVHDDGAVAFDLACGVQACDDDAQRALDAVRATAARPDLGQCIALDRGDLLVIDNRRALHGRSSFTATFTGDDRWIQRVYVRRGGA